jgi:hypothetical protein
MAARVQREDDPTAMQPDGPVATGTNMQDQPPPANRDDGQAPTPTGGSETPVDSSPEKDQTPIATGPVSTWGWGGDATRTVYAPCDIKELGRDDFLAFEKNAMSQGAQRTPPPNALGGFGITTTRKTDAKPPPIEAEPVPDAGRVKFRLKPTHAEMAPIQSAVTAPGEFVEGTKHWISQGGTNCTKDGNYPIRWVLTRDGTDKVKQAEHEHCNDFRTAFEDTLVVYASTINRVASSNRLYATEQLAIRDALSYLHMSQPDEMRWNYEASAQRTTLRDNRAHTPNPLPDHPQPDPGCHEIRLILNAAAWRFVPGIASEDLINPPKKP